MKNLKKPFCKACSLQENKHGQSIKCTENYYPNITFYSFEDFMKKYFTSFGLDSRVDLWTYYPEEIVFIEMKVTDWFIERIYNKIPRTGKSIKKAYNVFNNKFSKSVYFLNKKFPINKRLIFCIVFSNRCADLNKNFSKSQIKKYIRDSIIKKSFYINNVKIPTIVCQCDCFEEEMDKYHKYDKYKNIPGS